MNSYDFQYYISILNFINSLFKGNQHTSTFFLFDFIFKVFFLLSSLLPPSFLPPLSLPPFLPFFLSLLYPLYPLPQAFKYHRKATCFLYFWSSLNGNISVYQLINISRNTGCSFDPQIYSSVTSDGYLCILNRCNFLISWIFFFRAISYTGSYFSVWRIYHCFLPSLLSVFLSIVS